MDRVARAEFETHSHRITSRQKAVLLDTLSDYLHRLLNYRDVKCLVQHRREMRIVGDMHKRLRNCSLPYELVVSSAEWPTLSRALRTNAKGLAMYRMMMRTNTERGPWFPFFYSGVRVPE